MIYNPLLTNTSKVPLAIVTFHIEGQREAQLQQCIASVAEDLPDGAVHYVIPVKGKPFYVHQRQEALRLGEYVAFVDDDDTVMNQGISKCYAAIQTGNYGVAFTDENLVDETGKVLSIENGVRTYENAQKRVSAIHHLAMLNTSCIDINSLDIIRGRIRGVDWYIMKCAINGSSLGAIHVPVAGYNWTQSSDSLGKTVSGLIVPKLDLNKTGAIPVYKL